jgi:hypothetical protein
MGGLCLCVLAGLLLRFGVRMPIADPVRQHNGVVVRDEGGGGGQGGGGACGCGY